MTNLLDLAARVEAAEGPDRELDCSVGVAIGRFYTQPNKGWPDRLDYCEHRDGGDCHPGHGFDQLVPRYTASIDAAMTLVPEDYRIASFGEVAYDDEPRPWAATLSARAGRFGAMGKYARAATPALALCAAALRARSVQP